jgi:hypothetical protein
MKSLLTAAEQRLATTMKSLLTAAEQRLALGECVLSVYF